MPARDAALSPYLEAEVKLADAWLSAAARNARRQEIGHRWFLPFNLGALSIASAAVVFSQETSQKSRYVLGSASALSALFILPTTLDRPRARKWGTVGVSLSGALAGVSFALDARTTDADPWSTRSDGEVWLGAAVATQALFLMPFAFLSPGPSEEDFLRAAALPPEQRVRQTMRLLATRDRARRRAAGFAMLASFAAAAVAGIGASSLPAGQDRSALGMFAGMFVGTGLAVAFPTLLAPGSLERFTMHHMPPKGAFGW